MLLALAGKEAASNLFGSLSLIFSKSFKIWDLIRVKWLEWNVEEITLSYTKLIDKKWNIIYMPNKNIVTETIENLTQWKHKKFDISMPLPLDIELDKQKKLLSEIEKHIEKRVKSWDFPSYKLQFDSVGQTAIIYNLLIELPPSSDMVSIKKWLFLEIRKIFDELDIKFAKQS